MIDYLNSECIIYFHMFKSKNRLIPFEAIDTKDAFFKAVDSNEFPIRKFLEIKYRSCGNYLYSEDVYSKDVLEYLLKNASLLSSTSVGNINSILQDPINGVRGCTIWFLYKNDVYIRLSMRNQPDDAEEYVSSSLSRATLNIQIEEEDEEKSVDKTFSILFVTPSNIDTLPLKDFKKFIIKDKKGKVHIFIKNQYGEYDFEPIQIKNREVDLELNYGKEFIKIHKLITNRLETKSNGLYMFHGTPGTGKTTYIKHLANIIDKNFIYVPTNMLEYLTTDPNCLSSLLTKPNSIFILEDAERVILKREAGENSSVSSILNLSDGLMSDILRCSIILTYNCSKQSIDDALKRKGRLQIDYEFKKLSIDNSIELAKFLKIPNEIIEEKITEEMALADIYNIQQEVDFGSATEEEKVIFGFGKKS